MRARVLVALIAVLVGGASAAGFSAAVAGSASGSTCVHARVGGRSVCLKPGQRCSRSYEALYERHGLTCERRTHRLVPLHRSRPRPPQTNPSTSTQQSSTATVPITTLSTTVSSTTASSTTTTTTTTFSCPTEPGVTHENDCPPADPASPPPDFCSTHACIASFYNGRGTAVQCNDGEWSMSGGIQGACSYHGGESSNPPGPPPIY